MDDLSHKLGSLRHKVVPAWGPTRRERAYLEVERIRKHRRARDRSLGAGLGALALAGVSVYLWPHLGFEPAQQAAEVQARTLPRLPPTAAPASAAPAELGASEILHVGRRVRLADGSTAEVTTADGALEATVDRPEEVRLRLGMGAAHFEVVPNLRREFSVFAGAVEVVVVGTAFDVERAVGRVRVAVTHGKVRVRTASGDALLVAGDARWFDESVRAAEPFADSGAPRSARRLPASRGQEPRAEEPAANGGGARRAPARGPAPEGARVSSSPAPTDLYGRAQSVPASSAWQLPRAGWRSLNQSGDYEAAYRLLARGAAVANDPDALMEAADAARLSNHPEAAASYLRQVLDLHRASPVTPLAAFTLGRVLLERLGRPAEAAGAFATARALAPQGSLAQDALAREVEAWSKAGDAKEAYERSRLFMQRYPDSRRLRVVQLYGGVQPQ